MNLANTQAQPAAPASAAGAPTAAKPAAGGQNFWDAGGTTGLAPDQEFSELVEIDTRKGGSGSRTVLIVVLLLIIAAGGWFSFEMFVAERDPFATLAGYMDLLTGSQPETETPPPLAPAAPTEPAEEAVAEQSNPAADKSVPGNPYWILPNKILGHHLPMRRAWAPEEEETWRANLAHHFPYQHYKTVMDIREKRLLGSDAALWDALKDKKFWTRMFAAVGIAEFNIEISLQAIEGALNGARSELVADFFERFVHHPNGAQLFVMRQAIRLLDEKGRLVVLKAISKSHDELRDLYLVAATLDPGPKVQKWITRRLEHRPIPEAKRAELMAVVHGDNDGQYLLFGGKAPKDKATGNDGTEPAVVAEPDVEAELKEFKTKGGSGVEFYDGDVDGEGAETTAVTDETDPSTFEYQDSP